MTNKDLPQRITEWIKTQGFPLEMRVAQAFELKGISADHTRVYMDPDEGVMREIDIVAYFDQGDLNLHVIVECKVSVDKPWIIFSTGRPMFVPQRSILTLAHTPKAVSRLKGVVDPVVYDSPLLRLEGRHGYNLVQAFKDTKSSKDLAFAALRTVTKAAVVTARDIGKAGHVVSYLPAIVVEGQLFECYMENGELAVKLIERGKLLVRRQDHVGNVLLVHVVTANSVGSFVDDCLTTADALFQRTRHLYKK
jgi:hypothetical protein